MHTTTVYLICFHPGHPALHDVRGWRSSVRRLQSRGSSEQARVRVSGENGVLQRGHGRVPLCFFHENATLLTSSLETKPRLASME